MITKLPLFSKPSAYKSMVRRLSAELLRAGCGDVGQMRPSDQFLLAHRLLAAVVTPAETALFV